LLNLNILARHLQEAFEQFDATTTLQVNMIRKMQNSLPLMTVTLTADERLSHSKWMSRCRPNAASVKGSSATTATMASTTEA